MRKRMKNALIVLSAICCLTGCSTGAAIPEDATTQTETASSNSAQAYETNQEVSQAYETDQEFSEAYETEQELSPEECEQEERERREEIAEQYSIYSQFGLSYDKDKDRFFFDGNVVRYFSDAIGEEGINSFFHEDGTIDLDPVRNFSGKLIGLEIVSDEEFAARTEKHNKVKAATESAGAGESGCYESGSPDVSDDTLETYSELGVSYDVETDKWIYDGQQIYFFYDSNGPAYIDYSVAHGISIKVVRNKNVDKIVKMTDDEVKQKIDKLDK